MAVTTSQLEALILAMTRRVVVTGDPGDGAAAARQFDVVAMCAGFKCSRELLERLSQTEPGRVIDIATAALEVVREQAGDHVRHNTYFIDFPANVPDTEKFWAECLREALLDPVTAGRVEAGPVVRPGGRVGFALNLLSLPSYGRYRHSYADMLAVHDELIPAVSDRVTVLHLGGTLEEEAQALYLRLAGSAVPLSAGDTGALRLLAEWCIGRAQPPDIPARESRAVINAVRVRAGLPPLVTTVTDVLRLACELSGGDVSLRERTRFRSFTRRERAALMAALEEVAAGPKLADVNQYAERWKRLGERLHPHEYPGYPQARQAFAVARGELSAPSFGGQVEACFGPDPDLAKAVRLLRTAPGRLWRSADRLLRTAPDAATGALVLDALGATAPEVSGRVLLSVREHLQNRVTPGPARLFANRRGRAWTTPDTRDGLDRAVVEREYLRIGYLADLWRRKGCDVSGSPGSAGAPVTFIGLERPASLPAGSEVYTLDRLGDLIPA